MDQKFLREAMSIAQYQADMLLEQMGLVKQNDSLRFFEKKLVSPRSLTDNGKLKIVSSGDWTSGFFPGELWYLYEYSGDKHWLKQAQKLTKRLEREKYNGTTHDMGFKIYCSYGNGYRLTQNQSYRKIIIQAAKTLASRYDSTVGCIRSWDHHTDQWKFPVIIDNMMNLELLFEATHLSGDSTFYKIAVNHANTTMKNHFREDYSSWHVVDYDPNDGKVLKKNTHQGYSDSSAWARGQAWGLYGFTMSYRETGNSAYLHQAEHIADFILTNSHLPDDLIPYWDFDAPGIPNEPRDASAAAIMASALYELSTFSKRGKQYRKKADAILQSLARNYISAKGTHKGFLLLHSTGAKPAESEVDTPLIYADYYYVEALIRRHKLLEGKSLNK